MAKKHCDAMSDSSKIVLDTIVSTEKSTAEAEEFRQKFGFKQNKKGITVRFAKKSGDFINDWNWNSKITEALSR